VTFVAGAKIQIVRQAYVRGKFTGNPSASASRASAAATPTDDDAISSSSADRKTKSSRSQADDASVEDDTRHNKAKKGSKPLATDLDAEVDVNESATVASAAAVDESDAAADVAAAAVVVAGNTQVKVFCAPSAAAEVKANQKPAGNEDDRFLGFARVFCGTLGSYASFMAADASCADRSHGSLLSCNQTVPRHPSSVCGSSVRNMIQLIHPPITIAVRCLHHHFSCTC